MGRKVNKVYIDSKGTEVGRGSKEGQDSNKEGDLQDKVGVVQVLHRIDKDDSNWKRDKALEVIVDGMKVVRFQNQVANDESDCYFEA